jgi:3-oxoacyl-[acyl-carrier-protein] synthase-3
MIRVAGTGYALASQGSTVQRWCEGQRWGEPQLSALLASGAAHYHHAGAGETLTDIAEAGLRALLHREAVTPESIDLLVVYHTSTCNTLPAPFTLAGELRRRAGLCRAQHFSVFQQHCVSWVHGLTVMQALFARRPSLRHAILLGADSIIDEGLRAIGTNGIQTDASAAMLITRDRGAPLLGLATYNDARGGVGTGIVNSGAYVNDDTYLWSLVSTMRRVMKSAGTRPADITSVLPHNVNLPAWRTAMTAVGIPEHRLFTENFGRVGHAFGSDATINLQDSAALAAPGRALLVSSGLGGCFGGCIIETGVIETGSAA